MLARTFLNRRESVIMSIGKKKYIPSNYNMYPLKISVFNSIKKKPFYDKIKLLNNNEIRHSLLLLKNFKKSNLFVRNNITNTDLFVKLNSRNRSYNLFSFSKFKKLSLQKKINITSRQTTILKQVRLRVYNFYSKKARNYKITKFFLKLGNSTTLLNWLINWEFKLVNIILRSKMSRSYSQVLMLIKNNYVFINGIINNDVNYIVSTGDLIQIPINTQWFLRDRLQTSFLNKFLKELNKYTKKNRLLSNRYFFKFYKKEHS
jgi:ribosomal protein S4